MRRLLVLVNPAAARGRGRGRLPAVIAELERLETPHRVVETRDAAHAEAMAAAGSRAGETIVAMGGDGMLRPIARALAGSETPVALIPAGRGNDLARVLGIPGDAAAAARLAVEGAERPIDVGEVDGQPFLGIASFGFDSDANALANRARLVGGQLVYLYAALRALVAWRPATFTITVDGTLHQLRGYSVAVANSSTYGGGMRLAPHASLDDGELDVVATADVSKARFVRALPKVFRGTHLDEPSVTTLRGRVFEIDADRPFDIYADGDPIATTPARVTVAPRALRIVVPR